MKFLAVLLGFLVFLNAAYVEADNRGGKEGFIAYCTKKQSADFCNCAMGFAFEDERARLLQREKEIIEGQKVHLQEALERSIRNDPAMTQEALDEMCDVVDDFREARKAYLFKVTGNEEPGFVHHDHKQHIHTVIKEEHIAKLKTLYSKYGANETTHRHMESFGGGYCGQRNVMERKQAAYDEYIKRDAAGDVQVDYGFVIGQGVRNAQSPCKVLYKR